MHSESAQLNVFNTNAKHCLLEQLEESALPRNELIVVGQNRLWTVKFCVWGGRGGAGVILMKFT